MKTSLKKALLIAMKKDSLKTLVLPLLLSTSACASEPINNVHNPGGYQIQSLSDVHAPAKFENIHLIPLGSDKHASEFLIFIKKSVAPHYHASHSEIVYILEGEGIMTLGEHKKQVKKGDYIRIPETLVHDVQVTSNIPMKVLSVQTPEFKGKDRVFIN